MQHTPNNTTPAADMLESALVADMLARPGRWRQEPRRAQALLLPVSTVFKVFDDGTFLASVSSIDEDCSPEYFLQRFEGYTATYETIGCIVVR